jgi:hypothetical protein
VSLTPKYGIGEQVVATPMYATSEPPTSGAYQAPMPNDRGSMRVTAVDGGITYTLSGFSDLGT